jgi:hypothetical protein
MPVGRAWPSDGVPTGRAGPSTRASAEPVGRSAGAPVWRAGPSGQCHQLRPDEQGHRWGIEVGVAGPSMGHRSGGRGHLLGPGRRRCW